MDVFSLLIADRKGCYTGSLASVDLRSKINNSVIPFIQFIPVNLFTNSE